MRQLPLCREIVPDRRDVGQERGHDLLPAGEGRPAAAPRIRAAELLEEPLLAPDDVLGHVLLDLLQRGPAGLRLRAALLLAGQPRPHGRGRVQEAVRPQDVREPPPGWGRVLHSLRPAAHQALAFAEQHSTAVPEVAAVVARGEDREAPAAVRVREASTALRRLVGADEEVDPVRPAEVQRVPLGEEVASAGRDHARVAGLGRVGPEHVEEQVVFERVVGAVLLDSCDPPVELGKLAFQHQRTLLPRNVHRNATMHNTHRERECDIRHHRSQREQWENLRVARVQNPATRIPKLALKLGLVTKHTAGGLIFMITPQDVHTAGVVALQAQDEKQNLKRMTTPVYNVSVEEVLILPRWGPILEEDPQHVLKLPVRVPHNDHLW
mmetsp:Transcript_14438/g.41337  ORF Transcript_14438/g.41337 Transcript_14438/m.41337 type:complete len:381 (+) Transcript_14438:1115-2257(+)